MNHFLFIVYVAAKFRISGSVVFTSESGFRSSRSGFLPRNLFRRAPLIVLGLSVPASSNYYIGIWYKKVNEQTPVWVANGETPVSDKNSAEIKILDGNLVLVNGSNTSIWSTNISSNKSNSVVAVPWDDGNLILRDRSNSTPPLWQSFDNPGNTWLPGSKLSYNKITQRKQLLT
ncbi:PREDICTED: G-type lectin S-receptor-like serine/threonine-protein kinase At2g19130 [Nicotiana attenuata]|uniref:G-type lectin S-receptor-like serine/threonine-protein kinase At2g19130 n=1 Tax=Nicotiana attenuata TaxID=49451 RepID=UPI000905A79D|nr:PREDICTED: G-type lectin S-receptor-like serine/threonine-protein kinase At2g19130 [Nicotiana attenuata]